MWAPLKVRECLGRMLCCCIGTGRLGRIGALSLIEFRVACSQESGQRIVALSLTSGENKVYLSVFLSGFQLPSHFAGFFCYLWIRMVST